MRRMTNHRLTLAEVAGDITRMYKAIGGERVINEAIRAQNLLGRRLSLLIDLESSKLGPDDLDDVSALTLQEAFWMRLPFKSRLAVEATYSRRSMSRLPLCLGARERDGPRLVS